MCKTTTKTKMEVQEALNIMCKGIVSSKSTIKVKRGNYLTRKDLKAVHFLFETNRIPYVCKKTLDKAKDLAFHGGNLNRVTICILDGKMYIGANYIRLKLLKSRYYDVNFSNLWEIQAFLQYPDKIRTLEDIRSYSQQVSKGFKDGHYKISNEIEKQCSNFLDKFVKNKVSSTIWKNAKVLRCILQLLVINKNKMTITRLTKQLSKHKINTFQEEAFIKTDIKSVYERNSRVKLLTVA